MSIDDSALDLLAGGGASAKFPEIGTTHKGAITALTQRQQTKFGTGELEWWDDAKTQPKMEVVITLQTDERDADDATDDGKRVLYASGNMLKAIRTALAGRKPEAGGVLAVKYISDGTPSKPGYNPPKVYAAEYKAPSPVSAEAAESLI